MSSVGTVRSWLAAMRHQQGLGCSTFTVRISRSCMLSCCLYRYFAWFLVGVRADSLPTAANCYKVQVLLGSGWVMAHGGRSFPQLALTDSSSSQHSSVTFPHSLLFIPEDDSRGKLGTDSTFGIKNSFFFIVFFLLYSMIQVQVFFGIFFFFGQLVESVPVHYP